ncbi:MAG: TRAP transporter substrate-binding protein [Alphaproteobacteria bacterium]|nr:TRAP transporter substrate-binding protein [Alphaproteobacteria bacterium]
MESRTRGSNLMTKIPALAVAAGLVLAASAASAQDKPMVLKFAGWAPPQINVNIVSQRWAKQVEAASGGTVKIQFFWNSIANARTVYDVVRTGVADIGWILQPLVRGKFRKTSVVALPFLVRNSTEGSVALWNLYSKGLISGEYDQVKPLGIAALPPSIIHSRRPVARLADVEGMKFRIAGRVNAQMISTLKATGVQMAITGVYQAMSKGVINGSISPWLGFTAFKHQEVTTHHVEVPMGAIAGMTAMNNQTWARLPAKAKAAFTKYSFAKLSRDYGEICDKDVAFNRGKVAGLKGHKIVSFSKAEIASMKSRFKPIEAAWVKSTPGGAKILGAMNEELAKFRAMKK